MLVKEIHDAWGKKNYVYTYICLCICVCKYIYTYILKQIFCSFPQRFGMSHSGRHLETVSCLSCFKQKTWKLNIYIHFSFREIRLWKLPQATCDWS